MDLARARDAIDWLDGHRPQSGSAGSFHALSHVRALRELLSGVEELEQRVIALEARPGPDPRTAFIGG